MDDETQGTALPSVELSQAAPEVQAPEPVISAPVQASVPQPASRQSGIIERIQGINSGLASLASAISAFQSRLDGGSGNDKGSGTETQPGIANDLSAAEGSLQRCIQMVQDINSKF